MATTQYTVRDVVPAFLMHGYQKDRAIAFIRALATPADTKRRLYRQWCQATMTKVRRADVNTVAERPEVIAKRFKSAQLGLYE